MKRENWFGLAVFLIVVGAAGVALAQGAPMGTGAQLKDGLAVLGDDVKKFLGITAGLGIAIAAFGGALGQSRATAAAVTGIARNPGAYIKILVPMIVGLALMESLVLYAWIVALGLSGKI